MLTTFYWITLEFVSVVKMQPKTSSSLMSTQRDRFRFLNENIFPFFTFLLLFTSWKHAAHPKHDLFYCFQL